MTILQQLTTNGFVWDEEADGYVLRFGPFCQISAYFKEGGTVHLLLLNSDEEGIYDKYQDIEADDLEGFTDFLDELMKEAQPEGVQSQLNQAVGAKRFLELANSVSGDDRLAF